MKRSRSIAAVLCASVLLLITGCVTPNGTNTTQSMENTARSLYQQAADAIHAADSLSVYIGTLTQTTVGDQTFCQSSQQLLNYKNNNKDLFQASMEETVHIGSHQFTVSESYSDGYNYFKVNGSPFVTSMGAAAYRSRFAPAVLFDPNLYTDLQVITGKYSTGIVFDEPTGAEVWSVPQDAVFTDASGCAILNSKGELTESTYTVSYSAGNADITKTTKIIICSATATVTAPSKSETYIPLEDADAPRLLEQTCGYLLQAAQIRSAASETINCQAFYINRTQDSVLEMSGIDDALLASVDTSAKQVNQSLSGETTTYQLAERFQNGIYTISANGSKPTIDSAITAKNMRTYCQNILIRNIILPEHIESVSTEETDTAYRITFHANNTLAEAVCADICETLYNEPELLDTLSSASSAETVVFYLELDKHTGLPTASGLNYSASHTIEAISYLLTTQRAQTYQYE